MTRKLTPEQAAEKRALLDTGLMGYLDGAHVFPIAFRKNDDGKLDKIPLVKWGTRAKPIRQWADHEIPADTMGWGIACGPSGLVVLDGDRAGALEAIGVPLPETWAVNTGRPSGRHLYFRAPEDVVLGNKVQALGVDGLDVRAAGGYVVAPGAVRPDGRTYEIAREAPIAPLPDLLVQALPARYEKDGEPSQRTVDDPEAYCAAVLRAVLDPLEDFGVEPGGRNHALNRAAFQLGRYLGDPDHGYLDEDDVRARLTSWALDAGLGAKETEATLESGLSAGAASAVTFVAGDQASPDEPVTPNPSGVRREFQRLMDRDAARQLFDAQKRARYRAPIPEGRTLTQLLAETPETVLYRVDGLWPAGTTVLLAAPDKAGKTTFVGNVVRSLADGDALLGRFATLPVGRVALIDDEMGRDQLIRWLGEQGIRQTDAVTCWSLKGQLSSFDVLVPEVRAAWAAQLRGADVLVLDCLAPILATLGIDENTSAVGGFLAALDELCREAGIREVMLVHHTGYEGERGRGHSSLLGWPGVKWVLVKTTERGEDGKVRPVDAGPKFFKAFGRDVDLPESQLDYDPATRRLTLVGGSRSKARVNAVRDGVLEAIRADPGLGQNAVYQAVGGDRTAVVDAIRGLVRDGLVRVEAGANRRHEHYPVDGAAEDFADDLND